MRTEVRSQRSERETVETVFFQAVAEHTSLKRGVNERFTRRTPLDTGHPSELPASLPRRLRGFTLIELLVVIGIMAILAAMIIPITGAVTRAKLRSRTRAELRQIESAIENYKSKKGVYPPDNPGLPNLNQLYYELSGTVYSNNVYTTLDGNGVDDPKQANPFVFGQGFQGIVNTTKGSGDEGMAAQKFIRDLKPAQVATLKGSPPIKILVGSVGWDSKNQLLPIQVLTPSQQAQTPKLSPVWYVSTNPTNNPKSFDLWIDIMVQGKTNRICNWSEDPIVLQ
jgi:prepilin-type N-terminal cleavage/methylation domain-containing protein